LVFKNDQEAAKLTESLQINKLLKEQKTYQPGERPSVLGDLWKGLTGGIRKQ
jgi:hypothetical protein